MTTRLLIEGDNECKAFVFGLLRNIAYGETAKVRKNLDYLGMRSMYRDDVLGDDVMVLLDSTINPASEPALPTLIEALYYVVNVSSCDSSTKNAVISSGNIMNSLIAYMVSRSCL